MNKGNITKRECYNEYCDWDITGIVDHIEKVFENAPEIGLETIIYRTWEKAGATFNWHSFFESNKKIAKFIVHRFEHETVMYCESECSISQEYFERITKLQNDEESKINTRKNYLKIKESLVKHFGEYSVPVTFGVQNPYFKIKGFHKGNTMFFYLDKKSELGKRYMKAKKEEEKLMKDLEKLSIASGVGI